MMEDDEMLGLDRPIGDEHYRAYVGPASEYDLVSAMTFGLLTACGLRQHHRVLDVGCGSLRLGRLLLPYLNPGNYFGLEPNRWLVDDGVRYEVGPSFMQSRRPTMIFDTTLEGLDAAVRFDYVVAQSIFSHTAPDLLESWLREIAGRLSEGGILLATFIEGDTPCEGTGWIYPECVEYPLDDARRMATGQGLELQALDWYHPRQTWCALYRPGADTRLLNAGSPSWNNLGRTLESSGS
jgi:SAM-dependent methyltransferase